MNKEIKDFLMGYCKDNGHEVSDQGIKEALQDKYEIYSEILDTHRWWNDVFLVVAVDEKLIGYDWAETTGDSGAEEMGWEFDIDSVCEVEKKEKTVVVYEKIKET